MILLFTLERHDIFPTGDYQLKKAMCEAYHLEENKSLEGKMEAIASKWSPYRGVACRYLWRWRVTAKKSGITLADPA